MIEKYFHHSDSPPINIFKTLSVLQEFINRLRRYESKSEVLEYKAAADVTLPRKRELDAGEGEEQPKPKKIKVRKYQDYAFTTVSSRINSYRPSKDQKQAFEIKLFHSNLTN